MSKFEISNQLYHQFLDDPENKDNPELQIDTSQWLKKEHYSAVHAQFYHSSGSFKDYPVVNISYKAAELFCKWLTSQYKKVKKRKFKRVYFRLPTEEEWIIAARGRNKESIYGWVGNEIIDKNGRPKGNYYNETDTEQNTNLLKPVNSFQSNDYGMYNMSGNVSEMVQNAKIVKGGDWMHGYEYCKISPMISWDGSPKPYIGFRVAMIVLEKN